MKSEAVLDSFAILSFLNKERGCREIQRLFQRARKNGRKICINEINVGECFYVIHKTLSEDAAETFLLTLQTLPIEIVNNHFQDVLEAARIKARFPLSYADAFVIATARKWGFPIYTGDPEFKQVEHLVKIRWI